MSFVFCAPSNPSFSPSGIPKPFNWCHTTHNASRNYLGSYSTCVLGRRLCRWFVNAESDFPGNVSGSIKPSDSIDVVLDESVSL